MILLVTEFLFGPLLAGVTTAVVAGLFVGVWYVLPRRWRRLADREVSQAGGTPPAGPRPRP